MKVRKISDKRTRLKKPGIEPQSSTNLPKFGKIDGFELDEVIFSLLDGLVDTNDRSRDTIIKTLMKYAAHQPDFILKSILTFLQVQKTSINHQHSLLCFVKRCLVELKNVPNGIIKEILIFMLKELTFLKSSDLRYLEMREIVNTATVLCPSFSVDVILAFIKDIKQSEENFEVLCIYIRILTHLCKTVPRNSYVKSILISSHIMCLYNKEIFKEQNMEICKELSSLLFNLANMLILNSAHNRSNYDLSSDGVQRATLVKWISEEELGRRHTQLYDALNLEMGIQNKFRTVYKAHFSANTSESLSFSNVVNRVIRKISRPSMENIKSILEPLYGLMLDYYIPKIYINSSYNNICLELLYSLVVISEYVSTECLKANSLNLLNCIIVRFLYHVPNLQFNDNLWFKLYKINSTNLTNRFVSLFSNLNLLNGLPPKFFIIGMRSYLQILSQYNEHNIYINSYNLCNILFSLLITLYDNTNKHLLMYLQWFLSSNNGSFKNDAPKDLEFDSVYIDNIIQSLRILYNNSSSLVLIEFLYDKLISVTKSDVIVAMYVLIFLFNSSDAMYGSRMNSMVRMESIDNNNIGNNIGNSNFANSSNNYYNNNNNNINNINSSRSYSSNTFKRSGSINNTCIFSNSHSRTEVNYCNQIIMYRIVNNINSILNLNINDNYSLYIMIKFVNMLFLNKIIELYSTFNCMFDKEDMERRNKKIYLMINYIFEYKINIDINNRINMNMKWYNSKSSNKLDVLFFYSLYQYNTVGKNELPANKFIKNDLVSNEQELFEQCVENIIRSCTDYFLVYLVNKLMKNIKRNSFTIFEYLSKIFKMYSKQKVKRVLKQDELYNLLILALIYMHDPVNYFGEAYYASKLLFKLYEYVSSTVFLMNGNISIGTSITTNNTSNYSNVNNIGDKNNSMNNDAFKQKLIEEGVMLTDLSSYDKVDHFCLKSSSGNKNSNNLSFLYPDDIVLNFSNLSRLIRYLNGIHSVDGANVIRCLSLLMEQLKNRPNLSRNSSFSISTSTFLNPGSTLFGNNQVSVFRVNDMVIDTDLTAFQNLGILNVICTFTASKEGMIGTILSNASTSAVTNKEDMMAMANDGELEMGEDQLLFWSRTLEMKYKIFMLNGITMSNVITRENWKEHIKKLDNVLISNTLKDSSFSLFGKTASYLQSERNRLIVISALTHAYIQAYKYICLDDVKDDGKSSNDRSSDSGSNSSTDSNSDTNTNSSTNSSNRGKEGKKQLIKELSDKYNRIVGIINAKKEKLLAEKEGKGEKKTEERDCGYDEDQEHVVNRYILVPMINMFNNDTDVIVQECILNNLLLIINQASLSKMRIIKECNHVHYTDNVKNDIEVISIMFNKLISIMMRSIDENMKVTDEKIEQMFEKNEILNVTSVSRSVSEKDGALAYCSFLIMSSFSPHFKLLRNTNVPHLVMYYILYYADYYFYAKVAKFDVNFSFSYEFHRSLKIFRCIHYYLTNMYYNIAMRLDGLRDNGCNKGHGGYVDCANSICWDVLYSMIITILSDNNRNLDNMMIKNKLFILVQFLDVLLPDGNDLRKDGDQKVERKLKEEDEDNWVKIVILVWCYILKISDNNTKLLLIDILYRLLRVQSDVIIEDIYVTTSNNSIDNNNNNVVGNNNNVDNNNNNVVGLLNGDNDGVFGVRMDRISKLNGIDSINKLIPERLALKFVVFSINYLEIASYISNSLVKIIHRMMQQNMSMISVEHLQSSLVVIFKGFHECFQNNNLPLFLRSFLLYVFKYNINILFNVLFKYSLKFQSSVIFIIIKNDYLLHLLIEHLDSRINNQLSKYFHLSDDVSGGSSARLEYYGSVSETREFETKDLEPGKGDVGESSGNMSDVSMEKNELTLEYLLEYNMIIFSNNNTLMSCYSDYINRLIVFVNVIDAVNSDLNVLIKQKSTLEVERTKMVKLLEVIYGNAMVSRDSLVHYSVKIIGSNRSTLQSFLNYTYRVISLFDGPNSIQDDSDDVWKDKDFREAREELLRRVLLRILVDLIRYRLLTGYDLTVLKIIKRLNSDYELIYYYLKNMYSSGVNPYYNVYGGNYGVVDSKRREFLDGLITSMVLRLDEKVGAHKFYYYMKVFALLMHIVHRHKLKKHYGSIEHVICLVAKNKTFFVHKKLRHAYLVLYSAMLRYLRVKYRTLNRFENLKSYLMFPTAVAMLSSGTRKLERVSSKCLKLFFSLFFGDWFDLSGLNLSEEIVTGLMVRGNTKNRCLCNCNANATASANNGGCGSNAIGNGIVDLNDDDTDLFMESDRSVVDSHNLCVCNCFQLLHIFSYFMPSTITQSKQSGESSASNKEGCDEGIVVPTSINEEFRSIKRSQLDRKSSKVLFSSITIEEEEDYEFMDINEYYDLKLPSIMPLIRTSSIEDKSEQLRTYSSGSFGSNTSSGDGNSVSGDSFSFEGRANDTNYNSANYNSGNADNTNNANYNSGNSNNTNTDSATSGGKNHDNNLQFDKLSICPDILTLFDVCDYAFKAGIAKSNFMYNSDSLEEYFQKTVNKNNLSLLQLQSLNSISNSFLFLSKNVYRFITTQKYLQYNLIDICFPQCSFRNTNSTNNNNTLFSLKYPTGSDSSSDTQYYQSPTFEDTVVFNAVKLSVFLITRASLYLYKSNFCKNFDSPLEDLEPFGIRKSLTVIRKNHLIHFESLCNVVTSKLCRLIDDSKFRLYVYKQLQLLSTISPH
ncbi:hypothetical protein MACK_002278 [Theileria orientalis]|uniref:Uncharacterized protein n=1 Tax=Theileria orientalis TaxID=68886 RepID=A0A976MBV6_THEOR|nr:hypothetical protein MACK_002278 [Theileria orientalis]